jgi:hypothetical protein
MISALIAQTNQVALGFQPVELMATESRRLRLKPHRGAAALSNMLHPTTTSQFQRIPNPLDPSWLFDDAIGGP